LDALSGQSQIRRPEGDITLNGGGDDLIARMLKHHGNGSPGRYEVLGHRGPVDGHFARFDRDEPVERSHETRFPGAVGTR
jgi:hypothetical protein